MPRNKKTIFVADDDPDFLFQLRLMITRQGYNVITADSQKEAETILEKLKPDLAILDLMMENEDSGFILSYKLKKKYPDVPVIIITAVSAETGFSFGLDGEEDKKWIRADLYLEKGIQTDLLLQDIKKLLKE
jgi:DNA-binding response OmpR family regulator